MRLGSVIILAVSSLPCAWAHEVITTKLTWTREISRIVRKNCAGCHREGGAAPMSLATYEETRPWAVAIREEVLARRMPPWPAVQGYGNFKHELALSGQEISNLANWVEGGAPEGEPQYLPSHAHTETPAKSPSISGRPRAIGDGFRLLQASRITAIQFVPQDRQVKLRAVLPNGAVEPLIWLQPNKAGKLTTLLYQTPLLLPAGTMFETEPAKAGTFSLILNPPQAR